MPIGEPPSGARETSPPSPAYVVPGVATTQTPTATGGRGRTTRSRRSRFGWVIGAIVPVTLLILWQWSTSVGIFSPVQLPAPARVLAAAEDLLARGELLRHVGVSARRVLLGFAFGASLGLLVGSLLGLSRPLSRVFAPTVGAFRSVAGLAWVPLLVIWVGIGEESKVLLIAIGAFFPVYTTVSGALRHVDANLVEAGRAFGLRGARLLVGVQLPAALPSVVSGLRLALAQSWLFLVAAELLASSVGIGFLLIDSQNNGRVDRLILAIVLLAVLGKLCDSLFALAEKVVFARWT